MKRIFMWFKHLFSLVRLHTDHANEIAKLHEQIKLLHEFNSPAVKLARHQAEAQAVISSGGHSGNIMRS